MDIKLAVLADYCNISQEGKLNILGIFDRLHARTFPCVHPAMQLVLSFEFQPTERDTAFPVTVELIDEDGKQTFAVNAELTPRTEQGQLGFEPIKINHILAMNNVVFEKPGTYSFVVLVNGEQKARAPLEVRQIPPNPQGELLG